MVDIIKTNLTVYLPVALVRKINDDARKQAVSRSQYITEIFNKHFEDKNKDQNEKVES